MTSPHPSTDQPASLGAYLRASLKRGSLWASAQRRLRASGLPFPMSWPAFAFDSYRRKRDALIDPRWLDGVTLPGVEGLVSVVLPVYNGAELLREALDSILAQTYPRWELVAVDDGSTDASGAILDEYARMDDRVRVIHQQNRKLPGALNTGFAAARGEFLTWTSADNRLLPVCLSALVADLQAHPGLEMAYANLDLIGADGAPLRGSREWVTYQRPYGSEHIRLPADPSELNTYPNNLVGPAFLIRRRAVALTGEHSLQRFTLEDYDYWMRLNALLRLRHARARAPLYQYRFHGASLTGKKEALGIHEKRARLLVFDDFRRDFNLSPLAWRIEAAEAADAPTALALVLLATQAGGVMLSEADLAVLQLPRLWMPLVYAQVSAGERIQPPPANLPESAMRVLVTRTCPAETAGWDAVVVIGAPGEEQSPAWQPLYARDERSALAAIDVLARNLFASQVERELFAPRPPQVKMTAVVCAHHLPGALGECLRALARQDFPAGQWEVIVVNNNPGLPELDQAVDEARGLFPAGVLRRVHCPLPGLSHARNAGISEARGEVIAFIDDDAIAAPGWLSALWQAFQANPLAGVIGGKILLRVPEPAPRWLRPGFKRFWSHFDPPYAAFHQATGWQEYPWGANWAARRQALVEMGGFRASYGRKGRRLLGGEEIVAAALAQKLGWQVGVEPSAWVAHAPEPGRFTLRNVWNSARLSRQVWYRVQKEGYIPTEWGPGDSLRRIGAAFHALRADSAIKPLVTLWGELGLRLWLAADFFRRLRRSKSSR